MTELARRQVLTSLAAAPFAGLTLAAVLADPNLARAAAEGLEQVSLTTVGGKRVSAALAAPAKTPAAAIVLIHEWWGLNDQIKAGSPPNSRAQAMWRSPSTSTAATWPIRATGRGR